MNEDSTVNQAPPGMVASVGQPPEYLTTDEVAKLVRAPAESVRFWHHAGRGPRSVKIGRRRLYRRADVEAWLEKQYDSQGPGAA